VDTQIALITTPVGRRVIGWLAVFNRHNADRLRQYIVENYSADVLETISVDEWLEFYDELYASTEKLRVYQVAASDEHHTILLMQAQKDEAFTLHVVRVSAEYPHHLTEHTYQPIEVRISDDQ